jgi:hypothetical protein
MPKVTYLFGAGASAEALPLVKSNPEFHIDDLPTALRRVGDQIKDENKVPELNNTAADLKESFYWLAERSEKFNTVDTFAKYCYLKKNDDLERVKRIISAYFTIDQIINKKIDNRYLVFLTTILEKEYEFPKEVKILNWNYDSQFQIASNIFKQEAISIPNPYSFIQADPLLTYFPSIGMFTSPHETEYEKFSLVHLNGIAGYYRNTEGFVLNSISEVLTISDFLQSTIKTINQNHHLLSFGWEISPKKRTSERLEIGKKIIEGSEILVIIGYSFPFFNREVDQEILRILKQTGLRKIYYQDKFRNGDFLYGQFDLKGKVDIETVNKVDQLFIPIEL